MFDGQDEAALAGLFTGSTIAARRRSKHAAEPPVGLCPVCDRFRAEHTFRQTRACREDGG